MLSSIPQGDLYILKGGDIGRLLFQLIIEIIIWSGASFPYRFGGRSQGY